jgi:hypothetical protein
MKHNCDFCTEELKGHEFNVRAYRYVELKVVADFYYRLCKDCYQQLQAIASQARSEIRKKKLQAFWANFRQEMQSAGEI